MVEITLVVIAASENLGLHNYSYRKQCVILENFSLIFDRLMNNKPKKSLPLPAMIAIIGLIGTIVAAIIGIIPSLIAKPSTNGLPPPLPTGLPTPTPLPTVVGTPIAIGADIAASGPIGFTVKAYNVSLVVDEVLAYQTNSQGYTERPGYTHLLIKFRVMNDNPWIYIWRNDIIVIDDYSNEYHTWGDFGSDFPDVLDVSYNESVAGALAYRVPLAALDNNLTLRLETESYENIPLTIRIEIPLGTIVSQP